MMMRWISTACIALVAVLGGPAAMTLGAGIGDPAPGEESAHGSTLGEAVPVDSNHADLEPGQPSLRAAVAHAVEGLLERDPALMDSAASPRVLLVKEGVYEGRNGLSREDMAELDRAARVIASYLFQRNMRVTVIETPGGEEAASLSAAGFDAESFWYVSVDRLDRKHLLRLRSAVARAEGDPASAADMVALVVPYEDKPWVQDFEGFKQSQSGGLWLYGESGIRGAGSSARESALDDAMNQLQSLLVEPVAKNASWPAVLGLDHVRARLAKRLTSPVATNKMVKDWYLGETGRSYGKVYRGHVLVGLNEADYDEWQTRIRVWMASWERSLYWCIVILLVSIPAAFAGYVKADVATKGYFTNWLRLGAIVGVSLLGVLMYAHLF